MRNRGEMFLGGLLLLAGLLFLIGAVFNIDAWALCWPAALITIGAWLLARPKIVGTGMPLTIHPLGDLRRTGVWPVTREEIWMFAGDLKFDLTQADVPAGETTLRVFAFAGSVTLRVPAGVAVAVSTTMAVTTFRFDGAKRDYFLSGYQETDGYEHAERRVRVEVFWFAGDVRVNRG